jgi:alpha-L-arabinofuranosidase
MVPGAKIKSATATSFANTDIRAHNNLDNPNGVALPEKQNVSLLKGECMINLKPASVTSVLLELD